MKPYLDVSGDEYSIHQISKDHLNNLRQACDRECQRVSTLILEMENRYNDLTSTVKSSVEASSVKAGIDSYKEYRQSLMLFKQILIIRPQEPAGTL